MAVKRRQLMPSLITLALLLQCPAGSAHEVQEGHLENSLGQHHERRESTLMNKDILRSFRNRKVIGVQVKKVRGVRPTGGIKT